MTVGDKLREVRKANGLTQAELARLAGVHQSYVSRVERGQDTSLSTLRALAGLLDLELVLVPRRLVTTVDRVLGHHPMEADPLAALIVSDDE